jgi:predicted transcriptional regulator
LERFEAARREVRVSITAALLDEGLSTAEVGELFGVTRQLANRFARDARNLERDDRQL